MYIYYTYSLATGGEHTSYGSPNSFTVGNCVSLKSKVIIPTLNQAMDVITKIYPNPVSDKLTVEINATVNEGSVISIISMQGQVIYSEVVKENTSDYRTEIDVDNFARGMYLLKLEDENSSIQQRIIVQFQFTYKSVLGVCVVSMWSYRLLP